MHFALPDEPVFVGVSGGRSSGMCAKLIADAAGSRDDVHFYFNNTGRENPKTYRFVSQIEEWISRSVAVLEYQKPLQYGGGPDKDSGVRVTTIADCDRTGKPFRAALETIRDFRFVHKGEGPLAPNATARLCTAYLKEKLGNKYCNSFGYDCYTVAMGLRADEPSRIAKGKLQETSYRSHWYPLDELGIDKCAVLDFWSRAPFDLELQDHEGNCDACFLKDESDLALILHGMTDQDRDFWLTLEREFGQMTSRAGRSFVQILGEAPERFRIAEDLRNSRIPSQGNLSRKRWESICRQEMRIIREGRREFHCSCESAGQMGDELLLGQIPLFEAAV